MLRHLKSLYSDNSNGSISHLISKNFFISDFVLVEYLNYIFAIYGKSADFLP